jgi:hypothetical protein
MSNNGIPPLNDWQADNYPVIYDEGESQIKYVKSGQKINAGASIQSATVTLTDAQIKALPTTYIEVVAAPGIRKMLVLQSALIQFYISGGNYTNVDIGSYLIIGYGDWAVDASSIVLFSGSENNLFSVLTTAQDGDLTAGYLTAGNNTLQENIALKVISSNSGNFTGGNPANTLKVTVYYVVVDL